MDVNTKISTLCSQVFRCSWANTGTLLSQILTMDMSKHKHFVFTGIHNGCEQTAA
jgi:hypothetical protein